MAQSLTATAPIGERSEGVKSRFNCRVGRQVPIWLWQLETRGIFCVVLVSNSHRTSNQTAKV
jgi:hypothetical protein